MKILAFEAATRRLSVALWDDGMLAEKSADVPNGGSERLLPWANELLAAAGLGLRQIDGIAFGAGPGGFTGLRLACGVAQGLACGLDRPVVPVGTLAALALAGGDGRTLACLDARMHEIYAAAYVVAGETATEILPPKVGAGEAVPLPADGSWRGVGDGFAACGGVLQRRLDERLIAVDAAVLPTAAAVARLAAPVLVSGGGVAAAQALPIYVRDKVALTKDERAVERLARGGSQ